LGNIQKSTEGRGEERTEGGENKKIDGRKRERGQTKEVKRNKEEK
jgi:hypothetical protein